MKIEEILAGSTVLPVLDVQHPKQAVPLAEALVAGGLAVRGRHLGASRPPPAPQS